MDKKELAAALSRAAIEEYKCPTDHYKIRYNIATEIAEFDFGKHGTLKRRLSLAQRNFYLQSNYWKEL